MEKKLQKQIHTATEEEKSIRGGSVRCMNDYWGAEVQYRASFMTVMCQLTPQVACRDVIAGRFLGGGGSEHRSKYAAYWRGFSPCN